MCDPRATHLSDARAKVENLGDDVLGNDSHDGCLGAVEHHLEAVILDTQVACAAAVGDGEAAVHAVRHKGLDATGQVAHGGQLLAVDQVLEDVTLGGHCREQVAAVPVTRLPPVHVGDDQWEELPC